MKTPKEIIATKTLSTLFLFVAVIVSIFITTGFKIDNRESVFSFILAFVSIPVALVGIWIKKVTSDSFVVAFVLTLIGGVIILINGIYMMIFTTILGTAATLLGATGAAELIMLYGAIGLLSGIMVIIGAILLYPGKQKIGGILAIIFSLVSIVIGGGWTLGLIFGIIGGISALVKHLVRAILIITSAGLLLSSFFYTTVIKPTPIFPLVNDPVRFIECLIFALVFIIFIELADASIRFSGIIEKTAGKKDFQINSLFKLYFSFFYAPIGIAIVIAIFVLNANILLNLVLPLQFAESVEFNSVYGVAMVSALVFVPLALIITFLFRKDVFIQARPDEAAIGEKTQKEITKSKNPPPAAKSQAKDAQGQKASGK